MKKRKKIIIIILLLSILSLFDLALFLKNTSIFSELSEISIGDTSDIVEIIIPEDMISPYGLTYYLKNNDDSPVTYGAAEYIERYIRGNWYRIPMFSGGNNVIAIKYGISKGEEREYSINWIHSYGKLYKGRYRIVKKMRRVSDGYGFWAVGEFEVK